MSDVFVSYAHEDKEQVEAIVQALEEQDLDVWWDARIEAGEQWDDRVEERIRAARCLAVLWSEHSRKSKVVKDEVETADKADVPVVPARIDACELPLGYKRAHTVPLAGWLRDHEDEEFIRFRQEIVRYAHVAHALLVGVGEFEDSRWLPTLS